MTALIGWFSGFRPTVAVIQDGPAVVLVTVAASVAATGSGDPVANVFVLMAFVGVATGLAMALIGHFGVGDIVRFFPTTVISGFIAGTGWLLFKGGFDVMVDRTLEMSDIGMLFEPEVLKFWLPGLALGVVLHLLGSSQRVSSLVLGVSVILATGLFFGAVVVTSSIAAAEDANWFVGPFPTGSLVTPVSPGEVAGADWGTFASRPGAILALIAVSLVAVLLNLSGLENLTGQRLDLRQELRITGAVNVLVAPLGTVVGFHALGDTVLARQMGARTRAVPVGVGAIAIGAGIFGSQLIGFTPRLIAGGLLVAVGGGLLLSWLQAMAATSSRIERALSAMILLLIGAVGILEGITFGLVAACLIFVFRYSRIDPIKLESTARETPSRVVRSAARTERLTGLAEQVVVFQLTGYQFFGSFAAVVERIRQSTSEGATPISFVILDFRHVTGIDASAIALLDELVSDLADDHVTVLLSDLHADLARSTAGPHVFPGLDFAIEYAEESLLETGGGPATSDEVAPFSDLSPDLLEALTRRSVKADDIIIEQGTPGAALFLVLSGDLVVTRLHADGTGHRLRRIGSGTVIGERSVLLGEPRSARISAKTDSELLEITAADYRRLCAEQPTLALELQERLLIELVRRSVSLSEHLSLALR